MNEATYEIDATIYHLDEQQLKKLADFIKQEYGITNVINIDANGRIAAYNNSELKVRTDYGEIKDIRTYQQELLDRG